MHKPQSILKDSSSQLLLIPPITILQSPVNDPYGTEKSVIQLRKLQTLSVSILTCDA